MQGPITACFPPPPQYDEGYTLNCYGELNPMRPHRVKLVHRLVEG